MSKERTRFIEQLGRLAEGEGLPRIAGRMLGSLMLDAESCSLEQLALQLEVSRASISTNGRLLEGLGLIQRVTMPGDRRDYWQIPDPFSSLLQVGIRRMRVMQSAVREMREESPSAALTDNRLNQIENLYDDVIAQAERLLARWHSAASRSRRAVRKR
ncbi:MAG: hypothetical protein JOY91_07620 [Sinobacteraceae bacterium]|nr:hypothetical protein [Nevskiaceae bacterium]